MRKVFLSHCPIRDKKRWLKVDWTLDDKTIASALNVTPQSVVYHRKKNQLPASA